MGFHFTEVSSTKINFKNFPFLVIVLSTGDSHVSGFFTWETLINDVTFKNDYMEVEGIFQ